MDPFIGEIRQFPFGFPPKGWALCNGQLLPIAQNQALFSLLGTTYGGNGQTTFALPNLQGRIGIGQGIDPSGHSYTIGSAAGEESHTVTTSEMPQHDHQMLAFDGAADTGATATPAGLGVSLAQAYAVPTGGGTVPVNRYSTAAATGTMAAGTIANQGGNQPHENRQPFTTTNMCIALVGIFPSRN